MIARYLRTLTFLKFTQIRYRLFYLLRNRILSLLPKRRFEPVPARGSNLRFEGMMPSRSSYDPAERKFTFLNRARSFEGPIDWDFKEYGILWSWNLNYFDYLQQPGMNEQDGIRLILDYLSRLDSDSQGLAAYPTSLRLMNWIKFVCTHHISNRKVDGWMRAQYVQLGKTIEYHLLGNHLMENGFALLFGAYYFRDDNLLRAARKILIAELDEQVLEDGGHFELSPLYHQIILGRVLDCLNLVTANPWKNDDLLHILRDKAAVMLGWLEQIAFSDGSVPMVNDSPVSIAPTCDHLQKYARRLAVEPLKKPLSQSGYRKIVAGRAELVVDVGSVGAEYFPAHAHADTLNFELALSGNRLIVDSGVSTYAKNDERQYQRSTAAHNTVVIDGRDSSEVWGGFRVGRRARPFDLRQREADFITVVECAHDGYRHLSGKPVHKRRWEMGKDGLRIIDRVEGGNQKAVSRLHFHPDAAVSKHAGSQSGEVHFHGNVLGWKARRGRAVIVNTRYYPDFGISNANQCIEIGLENGIGDVEIKWDATA